MYALFPSSVGFVKEAVVCDTHAMMVLPVAAEVVKANDATAAKEHTTHTRQFKTHTRANADFHICYTHT